MRSILLCLLGVMTLSCVGCEKRIQEASGLPRQAPVAAVDRPIARAL